jgi:hypothetical protein
VRYWRAFTIRDGGILTSPMRMGRRWPGPGPDFTATCPLLHQPPDPGCTCGLYVWATWGRHICVLNRAPRVTAEVQLTGDRAPISWRDFGVDSARVASFTLLTLWIPGPDHCLSCIGDPDTREVGEQELAALADRYRVPVGRL